MKKPDIFISYSNEDAHFVQKLSVSLRNYGINIWLEKENIFPGEHWGNAIKKAIQTASVCIYISSKYSANSKWVEWELNEILGKGLKIIPLILDDFGKKTLPLSLRQFKTIDFRSNYKVSLRSLVNIIKDLPDFKSKTPSKAKILLDSLKSDIDSTVVESFEDKTSPKNMPSKAKGFVFISYADEDSAFVKKMRGFLKKRNYAYWDFAESDRNYHTPIFLELEWVIKRAKATLSIVSPAWKKSKWAINEFYFSSEVGIPVFLLKVKQLEPTLPISGIPYIDFTSNFQDGMQKLDKQLEQKGL